MGLYYANPRSAVCEALRPASLIAKNMFSTPKSLQSIFFPILVLALNVK